MLSISPTSANVMNRFSTTKAAFPFAQRKKPPWIILPLFVVRDVGYPQFGAIWGSSFYFAGSLDENCFGSVNHSAAAHTWQAEDVGGVP